MNFESRDCEVKLDTTYAGQATSQESISYNKGEE